MPRVTHVMRAGRRRILVLDRECDLAGTKTATVRGVEFEATAGSANVNGARAILGDALGITADAEEYPDEFFVGQEVRAS